MRVRIITAAVGIPLVLAAIWSGVVGIGLLASVAGVIAGYELHRMMRPEGSYLESIRSVVLVGGPAIVAFASVLVMDNELREFEVLPILLAVALALANLLRFTVGLQTGGPTDTGSILRFAVFGAYAGILIAHFPALAGHEKGQEFLLFAILVTYAVDSIALFVGVAVGRHKIAPSISPKKSWEGFIGGIIGGAVVAFALDAVQELPISTMFAISLGAFLGVTALLGDLYESHIKRVAGVKDSGVLIPGHGGILDRLDSLMLNVAVVYWVAVWMA